MNFLCVLPQALAVSISIGSIFRSLAQGCYTRCLEALGGGAYRAGGPVYYALYEPGGVL
jgi:hypothetical protein